MCCLCAMNDTDKAAEHRSRISQFCAIPPTIAVKWYCNNYYNCSKSPSRSAATVPSAIMIAHYCNSYCNKFTAVCRLLMHGFPPRVHIDSDCSAPSGLAAHLYFYFGSLQWFINITVPPCRPRSRSLRSRRPLLLPCFVARHPLPLSFPRPPPKWGTSAQ